MSEMEKKEKAEDILNRATRSAYVKKADLMVKEIEAPHSKKEATKQQETEKTTKDAEKRL